MLPSVEIFFEAAAVAGVGSYHKGLEAFLARLFNHLKPKITPEGGIYLSR